MLRKRLGDFWEFVIDLQPQAAREEGERLYHSFYVRILTLVGLGERRAAIFGYLRANSAPI
jgi:hypothetical protein